MPFSDLLLGRPLATADDRAGRIGVLAGVPVFGLDALGSASYGPEAALTLLIPLGAQSQAYVLPVSFGIIALLIVVSLSYRQTIAAYPDSGGSYTVATENLGRGAGLVAAAALMLDYGLVVAVGISAGVGALVSAVPRLEPHTLALCLGILAVITLVNLRGVREVSIIFMLPTYLFIFTLLGAIAAGMVKIIAAGGHPVPVTPLPLTAAPILPAASFWLQLVVFSNGSSALTGVEAVSNGIRAFREPAVRTAQRAHMLIAGILMAMLAGIAVLVRIYGINATAPGQPGYQSILSMMVGAVTGHGWFYYLTMACVLLVLTFSANTGFADFPRLCRALSQDGYLPAWFGYRGRRLIYSHGVYALAGLTAALMVLFRGITDRLIPLFAIGAFLAFTMSQAGMVTHWQRVGGRTAAWSMIFNGWGMVGTGLTLLVILVAKFTEGAWVAIVVLAGLLVTMTAVGRRRRAARAATAAR